MGIHYMLISQSGDLRPASTAGMNKSGISGPFSGDL